MNLLADVGLTKSDWSLVDEDCFVKQRLTFDGFHPSYSKLSQIEQTIKKVKNEIKTNLKKIIFWGTGCSSEPNQKKIRNLLSSVLGCQKISVDSDAKGIAVLVFGKNKGCICLLGTGSHCCEFDGTNLKHTVLNTGFIFGNEGSGYHISRQVLKKYFEGLLPDSMNREIENFSKVSPKDLISKINNSANPYPLIASFHRIVYEFQNQLEIEKLIRESLEIFFEKYVLKIEDIETKDFYFSGSISKLYQSKIQKIGNQYNLKIKGFTGKILDTFSIPECRENAKYFIQKLN